MIKIISTPIGPLTIESAGGYLTGLSFQAGNLQNGSDEVLELCEQELAAYFEGKLKEFTVPIRPTGTPFRMTVWEELRRIPYGETATYKEIAQRIGNPKAVRAVGGANHHNPIAIIIPCHRVIGADGSLTGFGGGIDIKRRLLELES